MKNSRHHMLDLLILVSIRVGNFCQGLVVFYHDINCFLQFWQKLVSVSFCFSGSDSPFSQFHVKNGPLHKISSLSTSK